MSKVFFSVSVSLDGYLVPPGMDLAHAGDPAFEDLSRVAFGPSVGWDCPDADGAVVRPNFRGSSG